MTDSWIHRNCVLIKLSNANRPSRLSHKTSELIERHKIVQTSEESIAYGVNERTSDYLWVNKSQI